MVESTRTLSLFLSLSLKLPLRGASPLAAEWKGIQPLRRALATMWAVSRGWRWLELGVAEKGGSLAHGDWRAMVVVKEWHDRGG